MIEYFLTTHGKGFSIHRELGSGQVSQFYLVTERGSGACRFLAILSPEVSSHFLTEDVFLRSCEDYSSIDSAFLQPSQCGSLTQGSLYYLSSSLPSDVLPINEYLGQETSSAHQIGLIGAACCRALTALHLSGRVHGDLVPALLLMSKDGLHIGDTGALSAFHRVQVSVTHEQLLETRYVSPEQILTGQSTIQSDIYSLGAILYQLLTGKPPYGGRTTAALMASVLIDESVADALTRGQEPGHVASAILRAIEKSPADRWTSAHQFGQALVRLSPISGSPSRTSGKIRKLGCLPGLVIISALGSYLFHRLSD